MLDADTFFSCLPRPDVTDLHICKDAGFKWVQAKSFAESSIKYSGAARSIKYSGIEGGGGTSNEPAVLKVCARSCPIRMTVCHVQ